MAGKNRELTITVVVKELAEKAISRVRASLQKLGNEDFSKGIAKLQSDFEKALAKIEEKLNGLGDQGKKFGKDIGEALGQVLSPLGRFGAGLADVGGKAVLFYRRIQQAGVTTKQMIRELAAMTPASHALVTALGSMLAAAGAVVLTLGTKMVAATNNWQANALESERVTLRLAAAMQVFEIQTGKSAGLLEEWNDLIDQLALKYGVANNTLAAGTSTLLQQARALGLNRDEIAKLLDTITALSVTTGRGFNEVLGRVTRGLRGFRAGADSLTQPLNNANVALKQMGDASGELFKQLSPSAQALLRFKQFMLENATASERASDVLANSLTGALARASAAVDIFQSRLGKGVLLIEGPVIGILTQLKILLGSQLPEAVAIGVGAVSTLIARVTQVSGVFLTWSATSATIISGLISLKDHVIAGSKSALVLEAAIQRMTGAIVAGSRAAAFLTSATAALVAGFVYATYILTAYIAKLYEHNAALADGQRLARDGGPVMQSHLDAWKQQESELTKRVEFWTKRVAQLQAERAKAVGVQADIAQKRLDDAQKRLDEVTRGAANARKVLDGLNRQEKVAETPEEEAQQANAKAKRDQRTALLRERVEAAQATGDIEKFRRGSLKLAYDELKIDTIRTGKAEAIAIYQAKSLKIETQAYKMGTAQLTQRLQTQGVDAKAAADRAQAALRDAQQAGRGSAAAIAAAGQVEAAQKKVLEVERDIKKVEYERVQQAKGQGLLVSPEEVEAARAAYDAAESALNTNQNIIAGIAKSGTDLTEKMEDAKAAVDAAAASLSQGLFDVKLEVVAAKLAEIREEYDKGNASREQVIALATEYRNLQLEQFDRDVQLAKNNLAQARADAETTKNAVDRLNATKAITEAENALTIAMARQKDSVTLVGNEVKKLEESLDRGQLKLGDFAKDSVREIADVLTGDTKKLGETVTGLFSSFGKKWFDAILDDKFKSFDPKIKANFLTDVPGWAEEGASKSGTSWTTMFDGLTKATDVATDAQKKAGEGTVLALDQADKASNALANTGDKATTAWGGFFTWLLDRGRDVFGTLIDLAGGLVDMVFGSSGTGSAASTLLGIASSALGGGSSGTASASGSSALTSAVVDVGTSVVGGAAAKAAPGIASRVGLGGVTNAARGILAPGAFTVGGVPVGLGQVTTAGFGGLLAYSGAQQLFGKNKSLLSRGAGALQVYGGLDNLFSVGQHFSEASKIAALGQPVPEGVTFQGPNGLGGAVLDLLRETPLRGVIDSITATITRVVSGISKAATQAFQTFTPAAVQAGVSRVTGAFGGFNPSGTQVAQGLGGAVALAGGIYTATSSKDPVVKGLGAAQAAGGALAVGSAALGAAGAISGAASSAAGTAGGVIGGAAGAGIAAYQAAQAQTTRGKAMQSAAAALYLTAAVVAIWAPWLAAILAIVAALISAFGKDKLNMVQQLRKSLTGKLSDELGVSIPEDAAHNRAAGLSGKRRQRARGALGPYNEAFDVLGMAGVGQFGGAGLNRPELARDFARIFWAGVARRGLTDPEVQKSLRIATAGVFGSFLSAMQFVNDFNKHMNRQGWGNPGKRDARVAAGVQQLGSAFSVAGVNLGGFYGTNGKGVVDVRGGTRAARAAILASDQNWTRNELRLFGDNFLKAINKMIRKMDDTQAAMVKAFAKAASDGFDLPTRKLLRILGASLRAQETLAAQGFLLDADQGAEFGDTFTNSGSDRERRHGKKARRRRKGRFQDLVSLTAAQLAIERTSFLTVGAAQGRGDFSQAIVAQEQYDAAQQTMGGLADKLSATGGKKIKGRKKREALVQQLAEQADTAAQATEQLVSSLGALIEKVRNSRKAMADFRLGVGEEVDALTHSATTRDRYTAGINDELRMMRDASQAGDKLLHAQNALDLVRKQYQAARQDIEDANYARRRVIDRRGETIQDRLEVIGPLAGQAEGLQEQVRQLRIKPGAVIDGFKELARIRQEIGKAQQRYGDAGATPDEQAAAAQKLSELYNQLVETAGGVNARELLRARNDALLGLSPIADKAQSWEDEQRMLLREQYKLQKESTGYEREQRDALEALDAKYAIDLKNYESIIMPLMQQTHDDLVAQLTGLMPPGTNMDDVINNPTSAGIILASYQADLLESINQQLAALTGVDAYVPPGAANGGLIQRAGLLNVGEGNRGELIVPLQNPKAASAMMSIMGGLMDRSIERKTLSPMAVGLGVAGSSARPALGGDEAVGIGAPAITINVTVQAVPGATERDVALQGRVTGSAIEAALVQSYTHGRLGQVSRQRRGMYRGRG